MKKIKYTALFLSFVLAAGLVLAGCGRRQAEEEEVVAEPEAVFGEIVEIEDEEPDMQIIGNPSASIEIQMTNEMGGTITGLSVKSPELKSYPGNMMESGQKFENDETVLFYYETEGAGFNDVVAVRPTTQDLGYWNTEGSTDVELDVKDISGDTVTFCIWWNRLTETDDIEVELDADNVGTFTGHINDATIEGRIKFSGDSVLISLDRCSIAYIDEGTLVFDEQHDTSWQEEGAPETYSEELYDEDGTLLEEEETEYVSEADSTYSLQITMETGKVYEILYFDVEDMDEVTLCLGEDGIAYLEYMSLSENTIINTKTKEEQIRSDMEAAQTVVDMIDALEEVTEDNVWDMQAQITAAREAYDALTVDQKAYVTNLNHLLEEETALEYTLNMVTAVQEETTTAEQTYEETQQIDADYIESTETTDQGAADEYGNGYDPYAGTTPAPDDGGENNTTEVQVPEEEQEWEDDFESDSPQ